MDKAQIELRMNEANGNLTESMNSLKDVLSRVVVSDETRDKINDTLAVLRNMMADVIDIQTAIVAEKFEDLARYKV